MYIHPRHWAFVALLQFCSLPCSGESVSLADIARAKLVVAGIRDGRERLQSGVFHATGYLKTPENGAMSGSDQSLQVDGAFDVARRLSRFDYVGPGNGESIGRVGIGFARLNLRFIKTPDKYYRYLGMTSDPESANTLDVFAASDPIGPDEWEFDPRLIGVFGFPPPRSMFQRVIERLVSSDRLSMLSAFEILDGGICRLEWLEGEGCVRSVCWVNENNGSSPIRWELYLKHAATDKWPQSPIETTEITWKDVRSTWVPETLRFQSAQTSAREVSLKFDWPNVNEPVSDDLFKPQQFNLSGEKRIVDVRLGTPVEDGTIGNPNYRSPKPPLAPPTPIWQIAGMAMIVVAGAAAVYLMSQRLKSK